MKHLLTLLLFFFCSTLVFEVNAQFPSFLKEFSSIISNEKSNHKKIKKITTYKYKQSKFNGVNITNFDSAGKILEVIEVSKNGNVLREYRYKHHDNTIIKDYYTNGNLQFSEYFEYKDSLIFGYFKKNKNSQSVPLKFIYQDGILQEIHKGITLLYSIVYVNERMSKILNSDSTIYAEFVYQNDMLVRLHNYGSESEYIYLYNDDQRLASIKYIYKENIENTSYYYFPDGSYSVKNSSGKIENWAHYSSENHIVNRVRIKNNKIVFQMFYEYEFF